MTLKPTYKVIIDLNTTANNIEKFELLNVVSISIEEDINSLTDLATVIIPTSNFTLSPSGLTYNDGAVTYFIKNNSKTKIHLYLGYDNITKTSTLGNYNVIKVFEGYISNIQITHDLVTLECQNEMIKLKKGNSIKRSYPSPVRADEPIDDLNPTLFVNEDFKLNMLIYNLFGYGKTDRTIPYNIYTYLDFVIGKLRFNNRFQISEILKFLKDNFGIYCYFRLEPSILDNETHILEQKPALHIGYKYWNNSELTNVSTALLNKGNFNREQFSDWNVIWKFSDPFDAEYNRIIDNNLEWIDTDKENLIVTIRSLQDKTAKLLTYVYPPQFEDFKTEYSKQKLDDEQINDQVKKDLLNVDLEDKTDYLVFSENEANTIDINIPNLDLKTMKEIAKAKYDEYEESGYQGSFITFGEPYIRKGDIVQIKQKNGRVDNQTVDYTLYSFYVDRVRRTYSVENGYRQEIIIGNRYFNSNYNNL